MEMEHNASKNKYSERSDKSQKDTNEWAGLLAQLVDKITGKDVSITYQFENLEIDVPKATGPNGQELGSAKWNINGKIVISSEVQEKDSPQK
jgi:hypothetical protein